MVPSRNRLIKPLFAAGALLTAGLISPDAAAQLRIATYNTLDGPNTATEDALVQTIFGAIGNTSRNGIARPVDIIGLQEQATLSGPDTAERTAAALNSLYNVSTYQALILDTGFDSIAYVYNSATVGVDSSQLVSVGVRPGHRVGWQPVGYTEASSILYTYSVHLKAGSSNSDFTQRGTEATNLRNNGDGLGQGANIIYMGDFNVQGTFEAAYINMIAAGNGQAFDPLASVSFNRAIDATQSTRTAQLSDGGANGGMDDRFDLQLVSGELLDGNGLSYIGPTSTGGTGLTHSYQAFGNDGNTVNQAINAVTANRSQSAAVNDALHDFSDHLPVVADYQLPALADFSVDQSEIRLIAGEVAVVFATVDNVAPVTLDLAADTLDYTLTGSGGGYVALGAYSDSLTVSDAANEHLFIAGTNTAGATTLDLTLESNDQGAVNGQKLEQVDVIGLDHAQGSFGFGVVVDALTVDFGQVDLNEGGGSLDLNYIVSNVEQTNNFTADLDIDGIQADSGDTDKFSFSDITSSVVTAGAFVVGDVTFDTTSVGAFSAVYNLLVSDEDVTGEAQDTLVLTIVGEVLSSLLLGDANNDGIVDAQDVAAVELNFGNAGAADGLLLGDANDDGIVDAQDVASVELNFGNALPASLSVTAVPEPASLALLGIGGLLVARRRRTA